MGVLDKLADRLRRRDSSRGESPTWTSEQTAQGAGEASGWDERAHLDGANEQDVTEEESDLPRYDELFESTTVSTSTSASATVGTDNNRNHDGSIELPHRDKGKKRNDPRRRHVPAIPGRLPSAVLDLVCKRGHLSPDSMYRISLSSQRNYDIVMPHLYRRVPIDRATIHKLLYGIPVPVQGFVFDPAFAPTAEEEQKWAEQDEEKRKYGYSFNRRYHNGQYRADAVVSPASEARKRRCLAYVKEVWVESVIPDWTTCRSLSILRSPETRRFVDASYTAPREVQYHPMRQPPAVFIGDLEKNQKERQAGEGDRTALLMPNVERMHVRPEAILAMVQWEQVDKSPHILPDALWNLCEPAVVHVHGSVMGLVAPDTIRTDELQVEAEWARLVMLIRKTVERLCIGDSSSSPGMTHKTRRAGDLVWHAPQTSDPLPYIPDCVVDMHHPSSASGAETASTHGTGMDRVG